MLRKWPLRLGSQQGFSLLEVLIASTIFAAVLLVASTAFKFFMSVGARSVNSQVVMQETMAAINIREAIKGLSHYYIKETAVSLDSAKLFFLGHQEGFTGISANTIDYPTKPAQIKVMVKKGDNEQLDIIYCEFDNSIMFPNKYRNVDCLTPKIIAANIKQVEFSYFGWSSLQSLYGLSLINNASTASKVWSSSWDASKRGILPQYIKISIEYNEAQASYQPSQLWFRVADADPVQFSVNSSHND